MRRQWVKGKKKSENQKIKSTPNLTLTPSPGLVGDLGGQ